MDVVGEEGPFIFFIDIHLRVEGEGALKFGYLPLPTVDGGEEWMTCLESFLILVDGHEI